MAITAATLETGAGATVYRQQQALLMDVTALLTTVLSSLVSAGLSAGTVVQFYEMRQRRLKEAATEKKQLNEAELNSQQAFIDDLLKETKDLRALAQAVFESQIKYERQIFQIERLKEQLERDKRDLQRLTEEQNDEIILWKAKFEAKEREFEHSQKRIRMLESGYEHNKD